MKWRREGMLEKVLALYVKVNKEFDGGVKMINGECKG